MAPLSYIPLLLLLCIPLGVRSASIEERLLLLESRNEVLEVKVQDLKQEVDHMKTVIHDQQLTIKTNLHRNGQAGLKTSHTEAKTNGTNNPSKTPRPSHNDTLYSSDTTGVSNLGNISRDHHKGQQASHRALEKLTGSSDKNVRVPGIRQAPEVPSDSGSVGTEQYLHRMVPSRVAFLATLPLGKTYIYGAGQTVKFNNEITDVGNSYHESLGVFIAPVEGLYVFSVTIGSKLELYSYFALYINGQPAMPVLGTTPRGDHFAFSSVMSIFSLISDDEVYIRCDTSGGKAWGNSYSSFSGFLLQ